MHAHTYVMLLEQMSTEVQNFVFKNLKKKRTVTLSDTAECSSGSFIPRRHAGLMVSAPVPGTSGPGLSRGRRHGVVLGVWCWARH